ncbi:MAG TPA: hypothetical protein VEB21_10650, partial [Terriglobales bacterium]|nr:hypothetical protein [Terriglobales bacterium]
MKPTSQPRNRLHAGDDLVADFSDGLRLLWHGRDWLGPIELGLADTSRTPSLDDCDGRDNGSDDLGGFDECRWRHGSLPIDASLRAYHELPLFVFGLTATGQLPAGFASGEYSKPCGVWPGFAPRQRSSAQSPVDLRTFGFQHSEFALPAFGDEMAQGFFFAPHRPAAVTPLLFLDAEQRCLLLAPLDHFHEQTIAVPREEIETVRCGWHGDLESVPAGFATSFAVWAAPDPRTALNQWGELLLRRNGTRRLTRYADELSSRLSYWTDNGAVYYYRTAAGCDYTETLSRAVKELHRQEVPVASVQLDSWFYPHEQ